MSNGTRSRSLTAGTTAVLLTIVFVVLRLTHVIEWPWILVLFPALLMAVVGIVGLVAALGFLIVALIVTR